MLARVLAHRSVSLLLVTLRAVVGEAIVVILGIVDDDAAVDDVARAGRRDGCVSGSMLRLVPRAQPHERSVSVVARLGHDGVVRLLLRVARATKKHDVRLVVDVDRTVLEKARADHLPGKALTAELEARRRPEATVPADGMRVVAVAPQVGVSVTVLVPGVAPLHNLVYHDPVHLLGLPLQIA